MIRFALCLFLVGVLAYTENQGYQCGVLCTVAAECNNQCGVNNPSIAAFSNCTCQPACLCVMDVCQSCCDEAAAGGGWCMSNAIRNLDFCRDFDHGAAPDPRCNPYASIPSWEFPSYNPWATFPREVSEFLHGIPNPYGLILGAAIDPRTAGVANYTISYTTTFTGQESSPLPTPVILQTQTPPYVILPPLNETELSLYTTTSSSYAIMTVFSSTTSRSQPSTTEPPQASSNSSPSLTSTTSISSTAVPANGGLITATIPSWDFYMLTTLLAFAMNFWG